jgi:putative DNA primase/helicase
MKRLVSVTAAEVTPQSARFAWDGRMPLDAVTVLAGPPGLGKTQFMIGACARATRGKLDGALAGTPANVLYVSAEDSLEHTLVPRFLAAGGDTRRMHFFRGIHTETSRGEEQRPSILIPDELPLLDEWLKTHHARIIVLDPIVALIPVSLNTHRDQHVRRALAPLAHIAEAHEAAIVAVMHLNKDREADALNRLSGSIGFGGAARSVLLFAQDPDDPAGEAGNRRVLAHVKCNVAPRQRSLAYQIQPRTLDTANGPVQTSIAVRDGNAAVSANDLLGNPTSTGEATARTEAREFLEAELADGPAPTSELRTRAEDAGLNWRTVERAKQQLRIRARKNGVVWTWELLTSPITPPVGLDGVVGVGKTDKADNTDGVEDVAGMELARLQAKFPDLEEAV